MPTSSTSNPMRRYAAIPAARSATPMVMWSMRVRIAAFEAKRVTRRLGSGSCDQRELVGMADRFDGQIYVEVGPVKVVRLRTFDVRELRDRSVLEPGEFRKRDEQLLRPEHQPEAVSRDVRHFVHSGHATCRSD